MEQLQQEGNNGLSVELLIGVSVGLQVSLVFLHCPDVHLEESGHCEEKS